MFLSDMHRRYFPFAELLLPVTQSKNRYFESQEEAFVDLQQTGEAVWWQRLSWQNIHQVTPGFFSPSWKHNWHIPDFQE